MRYDIGGMGAPHIVVVGAGVFGLTAAIELVSRGSDVTLVDPDSATDDSEQAVAR